MNINIIEAYKIVNNYLLIFVSGMSGTGISAVGAELAKDLKLVTIDTKNYCVENYNNISTFNIDGKEIKLNNYESDDIYDWKKINKKIKEEIENISDTKYNGILVVGTAFPKDKLEYQPQFHIYIKLSKENLLNRRTKYVEQNKNERCSKIVDETSKVKFIFNNLTFPYYMDLVQNRSFITKYINGNTYINDEDYNIKISDEAFNYIISEIENNLKNLDQNQKNKINNYLKKEKKYNKEEATSSTDKNKESTSSTDLSSITDDKDELEDNTYIIDGSKLYDFKET